MLWGQFINNSVTHNAYMYYYAQTQFASVVCGAFTSLLQATFCRWLIKENRVFWLEPVALGSRVRAQTTGYFNWSRVGPQNRVSCRLGIRSRFRNRRLWVPDSLKEWNRGSDSQFGIGLEPGNRRNRPSLHVYVTKTSTLLRHIGNRACGCVCDSVLYTWWSQWCFAALIFRSPHWFYSTWLP